MGISSFYKMRKPRQFDHKPIYWDPHAEEREARFRRIRREMGEEKELTLEEYKEEIRGSFIDGTKHLKKSVDKGDTARSRKYKNMRLLLVLVILVVLFWFMFWG